MKKHPKGGIDPGETAPPRMPLTPEQKRDCARQIVEWRDKYDLPYFPDKCCWCCRKKMHHLTKCRHLPAAEQKRKEQKAAEKAAAEKRNQGTQLNE